MTENNWLENLKVGDRVVIRGRYNSYIHKVSKITKTIIEIEKGNKFKKINGFLIGGGVWNTDHIEELTPEIEKEFKINQYIKKLNDFEFKALNESTLITIYNILFNKEN